jgi:hypothetical protein
MSFRAKISEGIGYRIKDPYSLLGFPRRFKQRDILCSEQYRVKYQIEHNKKYEWKITNHQSKESVYITYYRICAKWINT